MDSTFIRLWNLVETIFGWTPSEVFQSYFEWTVTVLGLLGTLYGAYRALRFIFTGRSISKADKKAVVVELNPAIDQKIEHLSEHLIHRISEAVYAAVQKNSADAAELINGVSSAIGIVASQRSAEARSAIQQIEDSGNFLPSSDVLADLASEHQYNEKAYEGYVLKRLVLHELSDPAAVMDILKEALSVYPRNVAFLAQLSGAQMLRGEFEDAISTAHRVIQSYESGAVDVELGNVEKAYNARGAASRRLGDYVNAVRDLSAAVKLATTEGDLKRLATTKTNLGNALLDTGDLSKAKACFDQSLQHAKQSRDLAQIAAAYGNLGGYFWVAQNLSQAAHHFEQALTNAKKAGDVKSTINQLGNTALVHMINENLAEATSLQLEGISLAKKHGLRSEEALSRTGLARIYRRMKRYDDSLAMAVEALAIANELGLKKCQIESLEEVGAYYIEFANDRTKAKRYFEQAIDIAVDISHQNKIESIKKRLALL